MSARTGDPAPRGRLDLYGSADVIGDEFPALGDRRRGRCYELAAYALAFGSAPADATLVHGSIDGGTDLGRFGHAWLVLADGRVWEPLNAAVYGPEWIPWAEAQAEASYTRAETRDMLFLYSHFGPWHDESEFRVVSERERAESKIPWHQRVARRSLRE